MEAFVLAAALLTVDSAVRESPEYALAGRLAAFPSQEAVDRDAGFASEHLAWLQVQVSLGPIATWVTPENVQEQERVLLFYQTLRSARWLNQYSFKYIPGESHWDEESQEWVDDANAFYHERATDKAEWLKKHLGEEAFVFGELPKPVTSMRR